MNPGPLLIIGGHEDTEGDRQILTEFARHTRRGKVVLATIASHKPEGYLDKYVEGFEGLGVGDIVELYLEDDEDPDSALSLLDDASGIFFSGGDQRRLLRRLAGSQLETRIREMWQSGTIIAGTSAGASSMGESMVVRGPGDESYSVGQLRLEPGLALLPGSIIDQHFAERGRLGRLLGALAHRPTFLGIGIDENTALLAEHGQLRVLGEGAVYFIDGSRIDESSLENARKTETLSLAGVSIDVLARGDTFDLDARLATIA